jgi:hypothetical protein
MMIREAERDITIVQLRWNYRKLEMLMPSLEQAKKRELRLELLGN